MILLTGASGFIGSRFLKAFKDRYDYNKIVALTSKPIDGFQYILHNNYNFEADVFIRNGFQDIETIIHAGSFIPKNANESNDISKCNSNISNSFAIISSKLPKLKKIVFLSTIDVYNSSDEPIYEHSDVMPQSLYGSSKLYCESMINSWAEQRNIKSIILRIGHVYGPGEQAYSKLIPEVMRNIILGKELSIWGTGNDIRSFIYIDDVINAILSSIENKEIDDLINIVSDNPISILQVVETIINTTGLKIIPRQIVSNRQPRNLVFNNTKMRSQLYQPKISFQEGIEKEWEDFKLLYAKDNTGF